MRMVRLKEGTSVVIYQFSIAFNSQESPEDITKVVLVAVCLVFKDLRNYICAFVCKAEFYRKFFEEIRRHSCSRYRASYL